MQSQDKGSHQEGLRAVLLMKKAEVEVRIRKQLGENITEDLDSVLGPASDLGDLSALEHERDVDYKLLSMHTEALKDINEALQRLDEGTYGVCEECGTEIAEKRLQAIPFALYCLECQEQKEKLKVTGREAFDEKTGHNGGGQVEGDEYL